MKKIITAVLILFLSLSISSFAKPKAIKILPLGDSITCASPYKLSYRYPLWKHLVDAEKNIEFIGSQKQKSNGYRKWENYKNHKFSEANECHSGWRADRILHRASGIDQWLKTYTPDIALIHLGTNDMYQNQTPVSTVDEIKKIITKLRGKNPRIKILVAKIIPLYTNPLVPRLNQLISELTKTITTSQSPVAIVDMYSGFSISTYMQKDKIHPNAKGEELMAKRWFDALMKNNFL
ncbi:MAG TPA: cellulose-binding protein [Leucothrix mucor]|nr:cellulose-binding protein [Leucothrix mucor]